MTATVTLGATIPIAQYANIQPSFAVEGATLDEAMSNALAIMKRVWDSVAKTPLDIKAVDTEVEYRPSTVVDLTCWASGTVVQFDPVEHVYSPGEWLSGSAFSDKYKSEFAGQYVAGKMAAKHDVDADDILAMWAVNAEASSSFGTAVHAALQLYGTYLETSRAVKAGSDESALTKNPTLQPIVKAFFEGREDERAVYEAFVADPIKRHCGQIDRLLIDDDDGIWVEDFKTNTDMDKKETIKVPFKGVVESTKMGAYWLQLSFYAHILIRLGRNVKGLRIHHWTGSEWVTHEHHVVDISEVI